MTEATPPAGRGRHTPGVWTATRAKIADNVGGYDYGISAVIDGKPRVIAEAFQRVGEAESGRYIDVEVEANARLIAAAPALLEALRKVVAYARVACLNEGMPEEAEPTRLTTQVIDAKMDRFALLDVKAIRTLIAEVDGRALTQEPAR